MTKAEVLLWLRLRGDGIAGYGFRRQHPIGPYIADFACIAARLVVEVDGATHSTDSERARDERRDRYLASLEWRVLRVPNLEIYTNLIGVIETIARALALPPSGPDGPPPPQAGED
jgi:very-short-patch-repair endonuclease